VAFLAALFLAICAMTVSLWFGLVGAGGGAALPCDGHTWVHAALQQDGARPENAFLRVANHQKPELGVTDWQPSSSELPIDEAGA
jgi:hypothetical protein